MSVLARFRRSVSAADQRIGNMAQIMRRIGLDLEAFCWRREGRDIGEAVRACRLCLSVARCTRWLRESSGCTQGVPGFCPNAQRFERAKAEAH